MYASSCNITVCVHLVCVHLVSLLERVVRYVSDCTHLMVSDLVLPTVQECFELISMTLVTLVSCLLECVVICYANRHRPVHTIVSMPPTLALGLHCPQC